ncbi:hypothetical protein Ais01nite_32640 [Asanoa ishikariensis]|uniref:Predicted ATPase n=1 Tax=Asanoa ishikariensis TaxID=137265 RepID=A0A1H3UWG5_9ACTN|nr:AAA family ATPase [Asanoa ishikariensis]GIF65229.1 hypothetical protein Ais01nite_32640 [Asanoa ishikariensis]SDZ66697.1 Predicted ATPase [Asanoa ishikariensis]
MPLRKLTFANYRCFRDPQEIEFAPVTVVLGKNNSGKSVLTRLPVVISTGFDTDSTAPFDLERLGPDAVDSFRDLIFDQTVHGSIEIGIEVDGTSPFSLRATVQYVDESRSAFVSDLEIVTPATRLAASWDPDVADDTTVYRVHQPGVDGTVAGLALRGLVPQLDGVPDQESWADVLYDHGLRFGPVRYLGPFRDKPARQHRLPLGAPRGVGERGEGTFGVLADDQARGRGALLDIVNADLASIFPEWRLQEVEAGPLWSTVLTRQGSKVLVNLADAGTGLAQVLPIIVQCGLDRLSGSSGAPPLQIIEEPEMHLHPSAHADLADLYLRTAEQTGTQFLIETHSETLLLRLRRRIAEGKCPPETVAVYVVEQINGVSTARRVTIDELGNLDEAWPEGYFSQDYHEVRGLVAAQIGRAEHAA